jgi:hypothetical protein
LHNKREKRGRKRRKRRRRRRIEEELQWEAVHLLHLAETKIIYYSVLSRVVPTIPSVKDRPKAKHTAGR